MRKEHQLEVGNEIEIDGQRYWIAKVDGNTLDLMRDPDTYSHMKKKSCPSFWPTFFLLVLIVIFIKIFF